MAEEFKYPADRFLLIGRVVKPHGMLGELKIFPYSQQPENILGYNNIVFVNQRDECSPPLKVKKSRTQGKFAVIALEGIDTRGHAEQLIGAGVLLDRKLLPKAQKNEYYWFELQGLTVKTENGQMLGKVTNIFSNGAQDIMVVGNKKQEFLIPILDSIILQQNEEGIIIAPPPGLLEINTGEDA